MTTSVDTGRQLHAFASAIYPICRSIMGDGVRETLRQVAMRIPLKLTEIPSGTRVYDWEVPLEWNIDSATLTSSEGQVLADFRQHNLHILNYSVPARGVYALDQLAPHLFSSPKQPDWIPYRTSYYQPNWGFCITDRVLQNLKPDNYQVAINSRLSPGSLTYAEFLLPGKTPNEVLLFTHTCHPSLANDNTTGIAIATALAEWLSESPRRYTYRIVFAPGTIGSLCWLKQNEGRLQYVQHGLVLGLLGDGAPLTYKRSRHGTHEIDAIATHVLESLHPQATVIPFSPYGYDERQLCSPGFNLPVGRLTRSANDCYREYHSSGDDLSVISPAAMAESLEACMAIVATLEDNQRYVNRSPKGEPRLGKRGLYGSVGGQSPAEREYAMLWVLNQSDGSHTLLDIAARSGLEFRTIARAARELQAAKLLRHSAAKPKGRQR
jgi:aminopeptidase-like protein